MPATIVKQHKTTRPIRHLGLIGIAAAFAVAPLPSKAAAAATAATDQPARNTGEDCDRGPQNCGSGPSNLRFFVVARFDCARFRPARSDQFAYAEALNRAFALPSGAPNPQVGQWQCRRDGSCFSVGGAPLDTTRGIIVPGARGPALLFEVLGKCGEFRFEQMRQMRITSDSPGRWLLWPRRSQPINFRIWIREPPSDRIWASFFDVTMK